MMYIRDCVGYQPMAHKRAKAQSDAMSLKAYFQETSVEPRPKIARAKIDRNQFLLGRFLNEQTSVSDYCEFTSHFPPFLGKVLDEPSQTIT
jgi:hypothetical protein